MPPDLDCYACHHQESPPQITVDADHRVILPKEHADLIIGMRNCAECHPPSDPVKLDYDAAGNVVVPAAHKGLLVVSHGKNFPGGDCYNCHNRDQLNELHTPEGTKLKFDQATLLCASCHGRIYRDWNAGAHGRTSGHWDPKLGPRTRRGMHLLPRSPRAGVHQPDSHARPPLAPPRDTDGQHQHRPT